MCGRERERKRERGRERKREREGEKEGKRRERKRERGRERATNVFEFKYFIFFSNSCVKKLTMLWKN